MSAFHLPNGCQAFRYAITCNRFVNILNILDRSEAPATSWPSSRFKCDLLRVDFARFEIHYAGRSSSMQVHEQSAVDLNEPVKSLLAKKGYTLWSIQPEASVFDAVATMSERHVGALIVVSADRLVGIISERDYAHKVVLKGRHSRETQVHEIMTAPVFYVTPEHSVGQCMHLMTSRRIRHLPVLDGDSVLGMVSIGDLVNWIITAQNETIRHLHDYITGKYPA
jgi:signal-transduction protein with cAMP-binding, CBS, and nucleotidyltransferase domain